jgi:hypothetical protein
MTLRSFFEEVELDGGFASPEDCCAALPREYLDAAQVTMDQMGRHFEAIGRRAGLEIGGMIALTRSASFSCTVTKVREGTAILIPLGMIARARVTARLLLQFYGMPKKQIPRYVGLPKAHMDHDEDIIPPLLKPIFLETLSLADFWRGLTALDAFIGVHPEFEWDVRELTHLSFVFVLAHEFAHVLHGHLDLLNSLKNRNLAMSEDRLRRGIEADADDAAARITLITVDQDIRDAKDRGQDVHLELAWHRMGYAVTMVFVMADAVRKHLSGYTQGHYNHPIVRCGHFFRAATRAIDDKHHAKIWRQESIGGWRKCMDAVDVINLHTIAGTFGERPSGKEWLPLHAMLYGRSRRGPETCRLRRHLRDAERAAAEARGLLPFQQ